MALIFIFSAENKKILVIVLPIAIVIVLVTFLVALVAYYLRKRARSQEKTAILTAKMTGYEDEVRKVNNNVK